MVDPVLGPMTDTTYPPAGITVSVRSSVARPPANAPLLNDIVEGAGITAPDSDLSYRVLWYNDESR